MTRGDATQSRGDVRRGGYDDAWFIQAVPACLEFPTTLFIG
jgi:hypothetical protein